MFRFFKEWDIFRSKNAKIQKRHKVCSPDFSEFYILTSIQGEVKVTVFKFFWTTLILLKESLWVFLDKKQACFIFLILFLSFFLIVLVLEPGSIVGSYLSCFTSIIFKIFRKFMQYFEVLQLGMKNIYR